MAKANATSPARKHDAVVQNLLEAVRMLENTIRYSSLGDAYKGSSAEKMVRIAVDSTGISFPQ